jgi:hypothetical protein
MIRISNFKQFVFIETLPYSAPGMATLVLIHSMIGITRGKFLALAHFKTRKRVLK